MALRRVVGKNIAALRVEAGISKSVLAKGLKKPQSRINEIESGEENLTLDTLEAVAKVLGVPPARLLVSKKGEAEPAAPADLVDFALGLLRRSVDALEALRR